ncbi:MAG: DNA ligase [Helicobacteraceae bacterium]|nr:DNA ligase [Helicobacteraceae bacterium]
MRHVLLLIVMLIFTLSAKPLASLEHAKIYKEQNVSGWVMSEKLDGIRGYWNGKEMQTKSGKKLFTPEGFTKNFPSFALDGELWSRHRDFEAIQSKVLQHNGRWEGISYNIFEVPHAKGDFYSRIKKATQWFYEHPNPNVHIISQYLCQNRQHLDHYLEQVTANGGEGVMVKEPHLNYTSGRTSTLLKVKKMHDMEGRVVAVNAPLRSGRMKSLTLELTNGIRFKLGNGFSDGQRLNPPTVGSLVTFKYYGFTKNSKPKFASFMRCRIE